MINLLTNILYYISSWVIVFVVLSWLIANCYPLMSRMIAKVSPEQAALCLLLYGLLAPAAASVAILLLSLPEFAFPFVADHCHDLDCAPHRLQVSLTTVQAVTKVVILVSLLIIVCALMVIQLFYGRNKLQTLNRLAEPTSASYKVLDSKALLAWCSGLIKPKIFISRGLTETLTEEEIQIVLAHEQAHVRRKDNLRKWAIHWFTIAWPKRYRIGIRRELFDYTEHVCDLFALKYQQETLGIKTITEALSKCYSCSDSHGNSQRADDYNTRVRMLKKAWAAQTQDVSNHASTLWAPTVFISSLWLIAIVFTVHIGHPVLEWIAA